MYIVKDSCGCTMFKTPTFAIAIQFKATYGNPNWKIISY